MTVPHLTRKLVLEGRVTTPDGAGGFTEGWVVRGTLWAEVVAGTGRDAPGEEITLASIPYRITVRGAAQGAPSRPIPDQRLRDGGRLFRILAVTERDATGQFLTCFAREEDPA
ncbi:MAG: head-tail adaptor protein [Paracoccaceae bacterium]